VQAIRNTLELVRTRLSGLPASAKLLAGSMVIILALGLFLVAQWSAKTESVPFAITPAAYEDARVYLANRGVEYEDKNGQLLVPAENHADLLAGFAQQGGGAEIDWSKLVPSDPFATEGERKQRHLLALQTVLSRTISGFRNVKSATVVISPKPSTPLGSSRSAQTASVVVTMRTGGLAPEQVDAIATMVAGTQAGMKPENVSVTDGMQAYRTSFGKGAASGENLEQSLKVADAVQARIANVLSWLPGVRIAVNAQVVTTERTSTTTEFKEGVVAPISEVSSTSESKGAAAQREPGVVPNTGLSLGNPGQTGSQSAVERSENKYRAEIPGTRRTEIDPTGYAAKIDASIAVPWSYFEQVWRMRNPPADGADPKAPVLAEVEAIRDTELARIRKVVEPLISTDVVEGSKQGVVEVTWFPDLQAPVQQASMAAGLGEIVLGGGGTIGTSGLIKPIGLGVLAIASLFFMFNIAKKASTRENLPSAEELAGVPPKLESDDAEIVGEADEATPALEGMELDDDSLRRAQMLEQLNDMAQRDPAELAGVLRRWMRATA
jgi:flagellar biosynthesis/type III secretory pathway M-ring protein FliF/YscJ